MSMTNTQEVYIGHVDLTKQLFGMLLIGAM
jgi:hypothetical protein